MGEITLTINGKEVKGSDGDTILDVCKKGGINVPTLCHYEPVEDVGACRMCLVEVDGGRFVPSCTTPAEHGMEIKTDTEELWRHRRDLLDLLKAEDSHYCMYCEADDDCELQDLFKRGGLDRLGFYPSFEKKDVDGSHPHIIQEHNRCILCERCVRVCKEIVANDTLNIGRRGFKAKIIADDNRPLGDSSCISCGACVQACPTGTLWDKHSLFKGSPEDCEKVETVCSFCSEGCGIDVLTRTGNLVRVEGNELDKPSGGQLCVKGRFESLIDDRARIKAAHIKDNGNKKKLNLEEALKRVSQILRGSDRVNAVSSDRLPTETMVLFHQIMKEFGAHFDIPGTEKERIKDEMLRDMGAETMERQVIASSTSAVLTTDTIIVYDTSILESEPILSSFIRRASKGGAKLVTIDSGEDKFGRYSNLSIKLENLEESVSSLNKAVIKMIEENLENASELPEELLEKIDAGQEEITELCSSIKEGANMIVTGPSVKDEESLISISRLSMLTKSRVMDLNSASNQAFKDIKTDILHESADTAYIFASDYREEELEGMLNVAEGADSVIVQAARHSKLTELADIVLPALDWFERSGSFVDVNGKEKQITPVLEPRIPITDQEVLRGLRIISDQEALKGLK